MKLCELVQDISVLTVCAVLLSRLKMLPTSAYAEWNRVPQRPVSGPRKLLLSQTEAFGSYSNGFFAVDLCFEIRVGLVDRSGNLRKLIEYEVIWYNNLMIHNRIKYVVYNIHIYSTQFYVYIIYMFVCSMFLLPIRGQWGQTISCSRRASFPFRQEPFGPMSQYVGDDTKDRWCMQFLDGDHRGILKLMKCGYDGEQLCWMFTSDS